eukprot:2151915-Pleurochrysis_carterae.AAC.2
MSSGARGSCTAVQTLISTHALNHSCVHARPCAPAHMFSEPCKQHDGLHAPRSVRCVGGPVLDWQKMKWARTGCDAPLQPARRSPLHLACPRLHIEHEYNASCTHLPSCLPACRI